MTIAMQPIYTQTVGAGGAASVLFSNIPQTFTDLKLVISGRSSSSAPSFYFLFNMDGGTTYSNTTLRGNGSAAASVRLSSSTFIRFDSGGNGSDSTANTFNNAELYMPNYASSNFKSFTMDSVAETNSAGFAFANILGAGLWRNSAAVTSVYVSFDGTLQQHSTFSLYGITKG